MGKVRLVTAELGTFVFPQSPPMCYSCNMNVPDFGFIQSADSSGDYCDVVSLSELESKDAILYVPSTIFQ